MAATTTLPKPGLNAHDGFVDALISAGSVREVAALAADAFKLALGRDVDVDLSGVHLTHAKKMAAEAKHWADLNADNTTIKSFKAVDFAAVPNLAERADGTYAVANNAGEVWLNLGYFAEGNLAKALKAQNNDRASGHAAGSKERGAGATAAHELWHETYFDAVKKNELALAARGASPAGHVKQDSGFKPRPRELGGVNDKTAAENISKYAGTNAVERHAEAGTKVTEKGYGSDWASKQVMADAPGPSLAALASAAQDFRAGMAKLHQNINETTGQARMSFAPKLNPMAAGLSTARQSREVTGAADRRAQQGPALKAEVHRAPYKAPERAAELSINRF